MGTRRTWTNVFPLVLSKHDTFYVFFSSVVYSSFASRLYCREMDNIICECSMR